MGLASNQARLNTLTLRKSDLELRLTLIAADELDLAVKKGAETTAKNDAMNKFFNDKDNKEKVGEAQDNAPTLSEQFMQSKEYRDYEAAMDELEEAEIRLDQQRQVAETEHTAVVAEKEEIEKLVGENIKDSFKYFN